MEIRDENYHVIYLPEDGKVLFKGSLRLSGMEEYRPISRLLDEAGKDREDLMLDLHELDFLNSSGINMLSKFIISLRQRGDIALRVRGAKAIPWQGKSLRNLQRLLPSLKLVLE